MLLNEIVTDVVRDEENDINTHTFNSAESEKLEAGSRQIRIDMTTDDEELFNARTELVKNGVAGLAPDRRAQILRDMRVRPPEYVTSIYAYTLQKNPGNVQDTLKVMGVMSAVKNRNAKEVMPDEEIQAYLDASVARIIKLTKKYRQSLSKYGSTKRENDEGQRMHEIYKKFLGPYLDGKLNKNSIIVPLGSTSGLVGRFAEALGGAIHSEIDMATGAFIKNHFPKLDMFNKGTKESPFEKELRIPKTYTTMLEDKPDMIADPTVQSWIRKLSTARAQYNAASKKQSGATAAEKKELQDHVNLCLKNLRQSLTHYITASHAAVSATLKEIIACRKRYASFSACIKTAEYKELRKKFSDEVAVIRAIPLPTYDVANFKDIAKDLSVVSNYISAQEYVADDIDQIVKNVNELSAAQAAGQTLQLQTKIDSKRQAFVASVTKLMNQAINDPFKVHNYYANLDVNNGKAFSAYMVLHDELYDKLEGKNIILVDDNIGTGATVKDAVKAIYYAGISPLNIIVMAPHYLDSGNAEGADKQAVATAKRAYNAREAANSTVLHQPVTSTDVNKQLGNISQINKLKNIAKAGAERIKRKLGQ